ncbi:MAG: hypothetical protein FWF59_04475 [Turicibacter sp.]|nr:hypothetical protein [Turicibacter sp.]
MKSKLSAYKELLHWIGIVLLVQPVLFIGSLFAEGIPNLGEIPDFWEFYLHVVFFRFVMLFLAISLPIKAAMIFWRNRQLPDA